MCSYQSMMNDYIEQSNPPMDTTPIINDKPHKNKDRYSVLRHFIDGFVIEEADTPFALDTGSLLTKQQLQDIWRKQQELIAKEELEKKAASASREISHNFEAESKDDSMPECEECGSVGKHNYSSRFCTITCLRRFNAARARIARLRGNQLKQKKYDERSNADSAKIRLFESPPVSPVTPCVPTVKAPDGATVPVSVSKWSVDDVCNYIASLPDAKYFVKDFRENEIDGSALLLLKEDHLIHTLNIKLGPALKLCFHIRKLREI